MEHRWTMNAEGWYLGRAPDAGEGGQGDAGRPKSAAVIRLTTGTTGTSACLAGFGIGRPGFIASYRAAAAWDNCLACRPGRGAARCGGCVAVASG